MYLRILMRCLLMVFMLFSNNSIVLFYLLLKYFILWFVFLLKDFIYWWGLLLTNRERFVNGLVRRYMDFLIIFYWLLIVYHWLLVLFLSLLLGLHLLFWIWIDWFSNAFWYICVDFYIIFMLSILLCSFHA